MIDLRELWKRAECSVEEVELDAELRSARENALFHAKAVDELRRDRRRLRRVLSAERDRLLEEARRIHQFLAREGD